MTWVHGGRTTFDDLLAQLSQEHEALQRRFDELLRQHRELGGSGDSIDLASGAIVPVEPVPSPHWRAPPASPPVPIPITIPATPPSGAAPPLTPQSPSRRGGGKADVLDSEASASSHDFSWKAFSLLPPRDPPKEAQGEDDNNVMKNTSTTTEDLATLAQGGDKKDVSPVPTKVMKKEVSILATVWQEWNITKEEAAIAAARRLSNTSEGIGAVSFANESDSERRVRKGSKDSGPPKTRCERMMSEPNCSRKLTWDLFGMMCLCWDFLTIPLVVFDMEETTPMSVISIAMSSFWTCDIVCSFFVGFYDKGQVELRPRKIWVRYLKSWFIPDVALVSVDWIILLLQQASASFLEYARFGRAWRVIRVLRIVRLLRVVKGNAMFEELTDLIRSELVQAMLTIFRLVWGVAMINHIIACMWYWVGTMGPDEATWVDFLRPDNIHEESPDIPYRYLTSLHWSLTQFTPASMEVVPRNKFERVFAIGTILLALVIFSSFVSSITAAMTHLRAIKIKQTKTQSDIRTYIIDNNLSSDIALQIHRYARAYHKKTKRVLMSDLTFVRFLPEALRVKLHEEVYLPRLVKHPLFIHWHRVDPSGVGKVCTTAMGELSLLLGEELFNYGDPCHRMYFAQGGELQYYHHTLRGDNVTDVEGSKSDPRRISEVVLWMPWEHHGRLVASSPVFLLSLDSAKLRKVVKGRGIILGPASKYAKAYIAELLRVSGGKTEMMLDVWDDEEVLQTLAFSAFQQFGMCDLNSVGISGSGVLHGGPMGGIKNIFLRKKSSLASF